MCMYWCLLLFIHHVYFLFGDMYAHSIFVHGSLTVSSAYSCDHSGMYVSMYICMVITYSKGKDQPGKKVVNPARGQLAEQRK